MLPTRVKEMNIVHFNTTAVELATALGADPREALEALMADTPGLEPVVEIEREVNEEELQESIMAYTGSDPVLSAAKNTAEAVAGAMKRAGAALTGEEPEEYIVRGRRKGITRIDE